MLIIDHYYNTTAYRNNLSVLILIMDIALLLFTDPDDPFKMTDETRSLGLVVCRGTAVVLICPADSMEPIANPFIQQQEAI